METVKNSTAKNPNVLVVTPDFGQEPTKVVPMPKEPKKPSFEDKMAVIQKGESLVKQLSHFQELKKLADEATKALKEKPDTIELTISTGYNRTTYFTTKQESVIDELLEHLKIKLDAKVVSIKSEIELINF